MEFQIGRHRVGGNQPTYFIADIAANHDGDLERAKDLIFRCADAGANAAKFQNFRAETIVSDYGFRNLGGQQSHQSAWKKSVFEVYEDASLRMDWTESLKETCDKAGIDYFTAPYGLDLVDALEPYVCAWKLGSGDITWHALIDRLASSEGKPFLIATGAADLSEVQAAMDVARKRTDKLVLMQCNTNYTGSIENFRHVALNVLKTYRTLYPDVVLGLSDHTPGHTTVLGAVALGARVIEKHFTDDVKRSGPDHKFSMDPAAWRAMVDETRVMEMALGPCEKRVMENESQTVVLQRRAIRTAHALTAGQTITADDLVVLRPCPEDALPPFRQADLVGRVLRRDLPEGECVRLTDLK